MSGWLLDTDILSEMRRNKPEPKVIQFIASQAIESLYISTVSLAEIRYGIEVVADPARRAELNDWLTHRVRPMFQGRILPISEDVMLSWRLMLNEGRKKRHTFTQPDLIIAATAFHYGLTIVTRSTDGYSRTGVAYFNPWQDDPT